MTWRLALLLAALAIVVSAAPKPVPAQSGPELLAQGVRAYQNLDYDAATGFLRRSLAATPALADTTRARALSYLGATEVFRGRRDSAAAVFRRLVLLDPRYRPDELIFPPDVSNAFEAIRRITKAVAVAAPADTEIQLGDEFYSVRLYGSSFHEVAVAVVRETGRPLRQLYTGPIGDSLVVRWDGLDSAGTAPATGRFFLVVSSRDAQGRVLRQVQEPLEARLRIPDTLPLPAPIPDSTLLPERGPRGPALRSLGAGLGAGVVVVLLPSVMASGSNATQARFVVAGAVSLSGVYGFLAQRPGRPLEANVVANRALRDAWERRRDQVVQENATRRRDLRLRIVTGPATPVERETP